LQLIEAHSSDLDYVNVFSFSQVFVG